MPAVKQWAPHGTVRRYRQGGCNDLIGGQQGAGKRCEKCIDAMRDYNSQNKAGQNPKNLNSNVVTIDKRKLHGGSAEANPVAGQPKRPEVGATEQAVLDQFAERITKGEDLVMIQMARKAARILDNDERVGIWPQTLNQLKDIIGKLTEKKKTKSGGRLASVKAMSGGARKSS